MRCLHLYPEGHQCPSPAIEGAEFCPDHLKVTEDAPLDLPYARRFMRRLGAALLLAILLFQLYVTLRLQLGW
jgi:hypothetical protein